MNLLFEYIKYRWKAKGRHGIHSPFIYDFVDKCQRIEFEKDILEARCTLFTRLKKDRRKIRVSDFGAGSRKMRKERRVCDIFEIGSSRGKNGLLLYQLSRFYQPKNILEFGTSLGVGTIHLAIGNPDARIVTVEACKATLDIAIYNFNYLKINRIKTINSSFTSYLDSEIHGVFDLVFIDGHHDGEALLNYLDRLVPYSHEETIFVLDDIRWSDSMFKAYKKIISDDRFHVSIDLFRTGIVMRRKSQRKEHFVISM